MRLDNSETWYGPVLNECREGNLSLASYCFLTGLPTSKAGSWSPDGATHGTLGCNNARCRDREEEWKDMWKKGETWADMVALEEATCAVCTAERARRNRLVAMNDERVRQEPFVGAPYIHRNNEPKHHALLL